MSQASNHVKWCISKAKKEIEECDRIGKRRKHRGLLEIEPDLDMAKHHLEKASHNLEAMIKMNEQGMADWSINASFYVYYHCFLAIAARFGYESGNQSCTIALIEYLNEIGKIRIDERHIKKLKYAESEDKKDESIIDLREEYTYGVKIDPDDPKKIEELTQDCKMMLCIAKDIVLK
jgi:uncharacterized protein (UPF0332 family)